MVSRFLGTEASRLLQSVTNNYISCTWAHARTHAHTHMSLDLPCSLSSYCGVKFNSLIHSSRNLFLESLHFFSTCISRRWPVGTRWYLSGQWNRSLIWCNMCTQRDAKPQHHGRGFCVHRHMVLPKYYDSPRSASVQFLSLCFNMWLSSHEGFLLLSSCFV